MALLTSPVRMAVDIPAMEPPMAPPDTAAPAAVLADTAKIMLTAGATPPVTAETVTHTRITPVPMATF